MSRSRGIIDHVSRPGAPVGIAVVVLMLVGCGEPAPAGTDSDSSSGGSSGGGTTGASSTDVTSDMSDSEPTGGSAGSTSGADTSTTGEPDTTTSSGSTGDTGEPPPPASVCGELPPLATDCALDTVLCVDDVAGPTQEYATLQAAADAVQPGTTVAVMGGHYAGFQVDVSGTADAPIVFVAVDEDVVIDSPAETGDGIRLQNVSHVRVEGFRIAAPPQRCIAARGATPEEPMIGLVIHGNVCEDAGVEGFYLSEVGQSRISGNTIAGSGVSGEIRSHGVYLANAGSDDTVLCGNVISGAANDESNGIHFNGDLSIGGDGLISGLVVEANVIFDNFQNGLNMDGVQDSVVRNNVVFGNGRNALRAYAIDAAAGPSGLVVVNNTFWAVDGWALKLSEAEGSHVVFNNILLSDSADAGAISIDSPPMSFDNAANVVADRLSFDGEQSVVSLAEWEAATAAQGGSLVAEPASLFVAPPADLQLLADAVAVDAGIDELAGVPAPAVDIAGASRPGGRAIDIGAHERTP